MTSQLTLVGLWERGSCTQKQALGSPRTWWIIFWESSLLAGREENVVRWQKADPRTEAPAHVLHVAKISLSLPAFWPLFSQVLIPEGDL